MIALLHLWLLAAAALPLARAEAGLTGETAALAVPGVETIAEGRIVAAGGTRLGRSYRGWTLDGLPVGMAVGVHRRVEAGAHLGPDDRPSITGSVGIGSWGFFGRYRFQDQLKAAPGVAVQVGGKVLGRESWGQAHVAAGYDGARGVLTVAAGGRYGSQQGPQAWTGAALERNLGSSMRWILEAESALGATGLAEATGRGGLRIRAFERVHLLAWGGGGLREAAPWAGGGLSVALYSHEPGALDRDWDEIVDGRDACRYEPEDRDGWEDEDGCPDPDNDGDGIPDGEDETPDGELSEDEQRRFEGPTPLLKMRIKPRPMPDRHGAGGS